MKEYNIKLIGQPDFYDNVIENCIDLNKKFRDYIFDYKKSSKFIKTNKLNFSEKISIKYILSNLEISYKLLKLIKHKNIGVQNILFSFNIIEKYLKILSRFIGGIKIDFYNSLVIENKAYLEVKKTILYSFYINECKVLFSNIKDGDIVKIGIRSSDQVFQLNIIKQILEKEFNINFYFDISLGILIFYENKNSLKKILIEELNNIKKISFKGNKYNISKYIFGKQYKGYSLFYKGCVWRKCAFCNIGKGNYKYNSKKNIDNVLNDILKNKVKYIDITDPSVSIKDLLYFCNKILEKNIEIKIHLYTRFTDDFNKENCKILAKAGVKYMGIGLETASTRLNNLINKYDKSYTVNDFSNLIKICEETGVGLHYYTIFGLPTETRKEIDKTYNFLKDNLRRYSFFSYTPGIFGLNKGTEIYNNPDKYGISFSEKKDGGEVFIENYKEKSLNKNRNYIEKKTDYLRRILFIPNIKSRMAGSFWNFVEHSNIFHIQKMIYNKNPYFDFFSKNKIVNKSNFLKLKYKKNKFIQYLRKKDKIYIKNWMIIMEIEIDLNIAGILKNYNNNVSLKQNLTEIIGIKNIFKHQDKVLELIENYFLIYYDE